MASAVVQLGATTGRPAPAAERPWGRFPQVFLAGSAGLAAIAVGTTGTRVDAPWGEPLFWLGLALIFGAAAARLFMPDTSLNERVAIVAFVGVALFLAKHLGSPVAFERYDELLHLRTLDDIVTTERLFTVNPLLPISPFYPGMEVATAALVQVSGMSYVSAGSVVLAVGRLILVLALFLIYERITSSARVASVGALVYMTNPNFVFFNAGYAYESVAIPLGVGLVLLVVRQIRDPLATPAYVALLVVLSAAVAATHHVTSVALVAFFALWSLVTLAPIGRAEGRREVLLATGVYTAAALLWSIGVAGLLLSYLAPVIDNAVSGLIGIMSGTDEPRQLFVSRGGAGQPLWSRTIGLAAPIAMTLLIPVGLFAIVQWTRHRPRSILANACIVLGLVALAYPASLAFRLTSRGAAYASGRSAEFLFLGVGLVIGMALVATWPARGTTRWMVPVGAALCVLFLVGGVIAGTPEWARVPRPYTPAADARSVEEHGLALASWAEETLGSEVRVAADRTMRTLLGAYGGQDTASQASDGIAIWPLFFSTEIEGRPAEIIRESRIDYVVVDTRLVGAEARTGYVESGEQFRIQQGPIRPAAIEKWEEEPDVSRVYDNGKIYVYDVRRLRVER